jgi:hypothetical protein
MVQIKKKQERGFWFAATLNSVPDVLIAAAAAAYFAIGIGGFFAIYFSFQALYLALWLKRIAWAWFLYAVWSKRKMVDGLEEALYQKRFPRPPEYVADIDEYMSQIADDVRAPPELRVKAAVELGTLAGVRMSGNALYAMQLGMAFEAALELYARRFPPRPEPQYEQEYTDADD